MERIEPSAHNYRLVPLEVKRKRRSRIRPVSLSLKVPWMLILIGFFLARAQLLDELMPFGAAFLAAVYRSPRPRPWWALLSIGLGYASLTTPDHTLFPYYAAALLIWLVGRNQSLRQKNGYWVFWLFVSFLVVKAPLTFRLLGVSYPMIWITAVCEGLIAVAAYSMFSTVVSKKRSYALDTKEFQAGLLLTAIYLGSDLLIGQLSLRLIIMFYLILAAARIGGASLAFMVGPLFALISLLVRLPVETAVLVTAVAVISGFLAKVPFGLYLAGISASLLAFGVPIVSETVEHILMLLIASTAVYLTPDQHLRQLGRFIPGTSHHANRQASHAVRAQQILEERVDQFSEVFYELAKVLEGSRFISQQLHRIALVVAQLGTELSTQVEFAEAVEDKLWQDLDSSELDELTVLHSNGTYSVVGRRLSRCGENWCNQVAQACSNLLGQSFTVAKRDCVTTGKCGFDISNQARYVVDVKTAKIAQGRVSGDNNAIFNLSTNRVGLLISDGMGTGERAASDSLATIKLLEKMLQAGYDPDLAVKVINQTLLARSTSDSFATIDFVVTDLESGQLEFVKIGAAPSFIKRGRNIEVIQNHALPIGILNHVEVEPERRLLYEGEYLIMITDGVLEFQRDVVNKEQWLCNILRRVDDNIGCQELANLLLLQSIEAADGAISDDMMVLVAKLVRRDPEIHPYQRS